MINRLHINSNMSAKEKDHRIIVNETIAVMKAKGRYNENELRNWLLLQVEGLVENGFIYIFPETFTYDEAVKYYNELVNGEA